METTLYTFPSDLVDEGVDQVVGRAEQIGVDALTIALAYHRARDFCPRRAGGKLVYRDDGLFIRSEPGDGWPNGMRPGSQPDDERAAVAELLAGPLRHYGWTVFLHNTTLGTARPDVTMRTAFGDPLRSNLCPAHPDVAAYASALGRSVARTGTPVVAEALSYLPFAHGDHHERYFVQLPESVHVLLGLCFCTSCRSGIAAAGADPDRLAGSIRRYVDDVLGDRRSPAPPDVASLSEALGAEVATAVDFRVTTVRDLTDRVRDDVRGAGGSLVFLDLTGAALGYDDGRPAGASAAEQGWQLGIDPAALATVTDAYAVLAYARDPERVALDVGSYTDALDGRSDLRVVLRPGVPDSGDANDLTAKLGACADVGAAAVDFYNYGMAAEPDLQRIADALARQR